MNNKCLTLLGSLLCMPLVLTAQKFPAAAVERTVTRHINLAALSRQRNLRTRLQLQALFHPQSTFPSRVQGGFPAETSRVVFQVQKGPVSHSTASAFALNIDGQIWGVTASHVMHNIAQGPYMKVQNTHGKWISAPITTWHTGNKDNADVAIFQIPSQLLPFIQLLEIASALPASYTVTQVQGFVKGMALTAQEPVLFSGPRGILLQDHTHREMTGFCGSPVLVNGQVAGLHVGSYSPTDLLKTAWYAWIGAPEGQQTPALHRAAPIQTVQALAAEFTAGPQATAAHTPLKVLGHTVATLSPQAKITHLQLLRNGFLKQTVTPGPLLDPEHLEQFFELEENDILRVVLHYPKQSAQPATQRMYEINVSTGQVTERFF